jgi:hypothetical protein
MARSSGKTLQGEITLQRCVAIMQQCQVKMQQRHRIMQQHKAEPQRLSFKCSDMRQRCSEPPARRSKFRQGCTVFSSQRLILKLRAGRKPVNAAIWRGNAAKFPDNAATPQ